MIIEPDLFIDRQLSNEKIRLIFSKMFNIEPEDIAVFDIDKWLEQDFSSIRLICETQIIGGEFSLHISLHPKDPALGQMDGLHLIIQICQEANCQALISDDSVNPYTWILVNGSGSQEKVLVDSETPGLTILRKI